MIVLRIFIIIFIFYASSVYCSGFTIYDGTLYYDKPNFSRYGVVPASILYSSVIWLNNDSRSSLPTQKSLNLIRNKFFKDKFVILDVEHWRLIGDDSQVSLNLKNYIELIACIRHVLPNSTIGYYGLPISRDYWRAIGSENSNKYKEWQNENDRLAILADHVDVAFPSLYTFYDDPESWVAYAKANIAETRRIAPGKRIVVFLWPRYHDSNKLIGGKEISDEFWRIQLETARKYADGIVLWGGWGEDGAKGPSRWNENASWWNVTKQFISYYNIK